MPTADCCSCPPIIDEGTEPEQIDRRNRHPRLADPGCPVHGAPATPAATDPPWRYPYEHVLDENERAGE